MDVVTNIAPGFLLFVLWGISVWLCFHVPKNTNDLMYGLIGFFGVIYTSLTMYNTYSESYGIIPFILVSFMFSVIGFVNVIRVFRI